MSSTIHFALLRDPKLVDVFDEEWEREVLPVDDAILPDGMDSLVPEVDDTAEDKSRQPEGWVDLGLQNLQVQ
ncbi:hypothetical protein Ndes2526A_g00455 [Nannochloris sp. 'desiccata']